MFRVMTKLMLHAMLWAGLITSVPASAQQANISAAIEQLQAAVNHGDATGALKARAQFAALSEADSKSAPLHYWVAVADYRATSFLMGKDKKKALQYVNSCLDQCDAALKLQPRFTEALALKGGMLGMSITLHPENAMVLGPKGEGLIKEALKEQPGNPRALLQLGISTLHKPALFGGGAKKAIKLLAEAETSFVAEKPGAPEVPTWGRDDALIWSARAAKSEDDMEGARNFFRRALDVNPSNGWAKMQLAELDAPAEK